MPVPMHLYTRNYIIRHKDSDRSCSLLTGHQRPHVISTASAQSMTHLEVFMHDIAYNIRMYPALKFSMSCQELSNHLAQQQLKYQTITRHFIVNRFHDITQRNKSIKNKISHV